MSYLPLGYTLEDFLDLADENNPQKAINYQECAEIFELEIWRRHSWIDPDKFYPLVTEFSQKGEKTNLKSYCQKLVEVERRLEAVFSRPLNDNYCRLKVA